ncbi:unnamed protein product [Fraxinus pennsylvanica]|uniref:Uncharacterized protein n=1 Tax=Fraxinus pennsylvanica TaxID=56036 RepID=A0AAD1Z4Q9_9LAMI|nr:unnamed protein product [Fraxinus pennsylvanica]
MQKMKTMDSTLLKASRVYLDCSAMVKKLHAMTYNAEAGAISEDASCFSRLSLKLTAEYFTLEPEKWVLPNIDKLGGLLVADKVMVSLPTTQQGSTNGLEEKDRGDWLGNLQYEVFSLENQQYEHLNKV